MKYKLSLLSVALLLTGNSWATNATEEANTTPYYNLEVVDVKMPDGAFYGPYPVAMSQDKKTIATFSLKASLDTDIDIGLPFTYNRACQYDYALCELEFYGSEKTADKSYDNAYQAWRNARLEVESRKDSYFMSSTFDVKEGIQAVQSPYVDAVADSDVKITAMYTKDESTFIIGYASAPFNGDKREYVRRAFIKNIKDDTVVQLLPDFMEKGGFSSAYQIKELDDGNVYVIGSAGVSFPENNSDYFERCYESGDDEDDRYSNNELLNCPGFDTQAWIWNVTGIVKGIRVTPTEGKHLVDTWIGEGGESTSTGVALGMNKDGVIVGSSSFDYYDDFDGARMRAVMMTLNNNKLQLINATGDIEDEDDNIYNTWAVAINDKNVVLGNREYEIVKGRNKPTEFFLYDIETKKITFPLLDKKVQTTKERLAGTSSYKSGANSRAYAINKNNQVVGTADDYNQNDPVYEGTPRAKTAFLYDKDTDTSWRLNDLVCTVNKDGTVNDMLYRLRSARVILDDGTILAEGYSYPNAADYKAKKNAEPKMFILTLNKNVDLNDLPNCWDSALLQTQDEPYERLGAGSLWFTLFALPLLLIRRFKP